MSRNSTKESQDTFYSLAEAWIMPAPSSKKPEERQFVIDSGAHMHMISKKNLTSGEVDTLKRFRKPITVEIANGEVQTNEEAQVYVHDLHFFVTVQLLEDTPAVLSLGKLRMLVWQHKKRKRKVHFSTSDCDGQAADAVSAYAQVNWRTDAPRLLKILQSECPDIWIRLPRHKCLKKHLLVSCGKDSSKLFYWNLDGTKYRIGHVFLFTENKGLFG